MAPSAWSAKFAPSNAWPCAKDHWTPPIVKTVASSGAGIEELVQTIDQYRSYLEQDDRARARRIENWRERIAEMLRDALFQRVLSLLPERERGRALCR